MSTPLASRTTVSSRNKMAATGLHTHNNHHRPHAPLATKTPSATTTISSISRLPPRTAFKPPLTRIEITAATLAATSSRIALPRSRLSANTATAATTSATTTSTASKLPPSFASSDRRAITTNGKTSHQVPARPLHSSRVGGPPAGGVPSFANSRSSSKLSSVSSSVTNNHRDVNSLASSRQSSLTNAQANARRQNTIGGGSATSASSHYVPDTNAIRKGLAKFSNPMECQRQFQALNSQLRELTEINEHKEQTIGELQEQLQQAQAKGLGYATVVQYLAKKLKLAADVDLEEECEQLKSKVDQLMVKDREHEDRLESIVNDYKRHVQLEQDLRAALGKEFEDTKQAHSIEVTELKDAHRAEVTDLIEEHSKIKSDLDSRIEVLETELNTRTKELTELRKEFDHLLNSFNKLEESLTKDKDARVKYAQEKVNQLQKDVESLNSVLEMRTERIHALEKDSILLGEVQQELMTSQDMNKTLKQQLESLTAALENKRVQYENLFADHEKIAQDLKRERKERRRMTMRTEQLEYVLNESCANETTNNITVLDSSSVGS